MNSPLKSSGEHETNTNHGTINPADNKDDKASEDVETKTFNPTLTENDCKEEDLKLLKGDAIGDTLYSERFVLNTLLKLGQLSKDLQQEEAIERDLCSLWDMTIEKDVVDFLLKQDILELFASIIKSTEDKRLSEILVGILANMVSFHEARHELEKQDETVLVLLELTSCLDSLTLEQLMRLFAVIFIKMEESSVSKWYEYILKSEQFAQNIAFILTSAVNTTLVLQAMETLNSILAKFALIETPKEGETKIPSFEKVFVDSSIIGATIEGLQTIHNDSNLLGDSYEAIPESLIKSNQTFCNIHSILTQYGDISKEAYKPCNDEMLASLKEILKTIGGDAKQWQQYEQEVLESLNDILRVLENPFDLEIAQCLLKLHFNVSAIHEKNLTKPPKTNDFESDEDDDGKVEDYDLLLTVLLNTIYFLIHKADKDMLKQFISVCPRKYISKLMDTLQEPIESESLKSCYDKLKDALEGK